MGRYGVNRPNAWRGARPSPEGDEPPDQSPPLSVRRSIWLEHAPPRIAAPQARSFTRCETRRDASRTYRRTNVLTVPTSSGGQSERSNRVGSRHYLVTCSCGWGRNAHLPGRTENRPSKAKRMPLTESYTECVFVAAISPEEGRRGKNCYVSSSHTTTPDLRLRSSVGESSGWSQTWHGLGRARRARRGQAKASSARTRSVHSDAVELNHSELRIRADRKEPGYIEGMLLEGPE